MSLQVFSTVKATGHEVRLVPVSWTHHNQVSVSILLEMCWSKSDSAFAKYFWKDCLGIVDGMFTRDPTVVSGHLVKPSLVVRIPEGVGCLQLNSDQNL